ncbi:alternative ribosome rescue aminoacyl-tRNA hydrolase ArfB [Roseisolibacter sp. H3M3-2]|uniref:alternative ribosome rescue aminoacyl-tRNA hydrolase ArfB n=1 Tax=Roseisolibacter sp. H3M3-2 TaxID=3031323 RepID=UPI0023DCE16E|nr:alternative ribosome rescue aminoacyl-tRNA hydrolase ArfB [Roseisolibacter sp. H3M3-2]MDF1503696.1 alternative ribosome rescue aminoacyl-tRNA hydrolase ArfB [Roseisolibacter sp. H3M3-2]
MSAPVGPDAPAPDAIAVTRTLAIPRAELDVKATRAGGPGGQHVNTSSTRIELRWNVRTSRVLADEQRERLLERLAARLDADGALRIVSSEHRSQLQNREAAEARLAALVRDGLKVPKVRRPTKPSRAAKMRRLDEKRKQSEKKQQRRRADD